jgi:hypothetical protein
MTSWIVKTGYAVAIVGGSLGLACNRTAPSNEPSVRDSAGVRIVQNPVARVDHHPWEIGTRPTLTIGVGTQPQNQLFHVVGTFRLSDGRVVVANAGSYEIRFFDQTGRFLSAAGGAGDGPGEFRSLYGIYRLPGDSIAAYDTQQQRMTVFDPHGSLARSFRTLPPAGATRAVPAGPLADAGWLMFFSQSIANIGPGPSRLALYLARYDRTGTFRDTVAVVPGFEIYVQEAPPSRAIPAVPYGRGASIATTDSGFLVAVNDRFEVRRYDDSGHLNTIIRKPAEPRPVTAADVAAARTMQLEMVQNPLQRTLLSDAYESMSIPTTMPPIGSLALERIPWVVVDPTGAFWVLNYKAPADTSSTWSVFQSDGRFSGTVTLPDRFTLYDVGDGYALGVHRDSLDVEQVVMYQLARP